MKLFKVMGYLFISCVRMVLSKCPVSLMSVIKWQREKRKNSRHLCALLLRTKILQLSWKTVQWFRKKSIQERALASQGPKLECLGSTCGSASCLQFRANVDWEVGGSRKWVPAAHGGHLGRVCLAATAVDIWGVTHGWGLSPHSFLFDSWMNN